jgi:hypothetical protein
MAGKNITVSTGHLAEMLGVSVYGTVPDLYPRLAPVIFRPEQSRSNGC